MIFSNVLCIIWFCGKLDVVDYLTITSNTIRTTKWLRSAHLHLAVRRARRKGEAVATGLLRLRAFLPYRHHHLQILRVRQEHVQRDITNPHRLAFYFRIFPYRTFRNILILVAFLSLGYGVSIDITILFQW